jgi:hypothetical protein
LPCAPARTSSDEEAQRPMSAEFDLDFDQMETDLAHVLSLKSCVQNRSHELRRKRRLSNWKKRHIKDERRAWKLLFGEKPKFTCKASLF